VVTHFGSFGTFDTKGSQACGEAERPIEDHEDLRGVLALSSPARATHRVRVAA